MHPQRLLFMSALALLGLLPAGQPAVAEAAGPSCAAIRSSFQTGAFDGREAIVDALQDHLRAAGADKPLGRDGKVQAILMAVLRCEALGQGNFFRALDRTVAQVEQERAQRHGHD